jgi:poly(A) polymerase
LRGDPVRAGPLAARIARRVASDGILRDIRAAAGATGVPAWLVGGTVRDAALGRPSSDLDVAAGRPAPRLVRALEALWGRRSFRFEKRRVITWRFDLHGRKVDVVDASGRGIARDLRRRDFTLNAIAVDLVGGRVVDPLDGLRDLEAGLLRAPLCGTFRNDPVRVLRAARFLAEFPRFRLHGDTRRAAAASARAVWCASAERLRDEMDKLLASRSPSRGLEEMARLTILGAVVPELVPARRCAAGKGRPNVWRHTVDAIRRSERPGRLPGAVVLADPQSLRLLRWALLLHDIAKPDTLSRGSDGRPTFHGHEAKGSRRADAVLRRLRFPKQLRLRVARVVLLHLRPHHLADAGAPPRGLGRLVRDAGDDLPVLVAHAALDALASGAPDARARWRRLRPVLLDLLARHRAAREAPRPPLVGGHDVMKLLGIGPGPEVGKLIAEVRDLQDQGALGSRDDALAWIADRAARRRSREATP